MRILFINKFLYPNGGSETYIFRLGEYLTAQGHEVQYFGMEHDGRCVGNRVGAYTSDMDFHGGSKLGKITYPLKTIYSAEARQKLRLVLDDFQPDVVHLNNFTYQLTPSIILEIVKWRGERSRVILSAADAGKDGGAAEDGTAEGAGDDSASGAAGDGAAGKAANSSAGADSESGSGICRIVFTAHDSNLVCPNHLMRNPNTGELCERCLGGHFVNCVKGRCIHGSLAKSAVGTAEGYYWKLRGTYRYIDAVICCSEFMKRKMDTNPLFAGKTIAMHNFVDSPAAAAQEGGASAGGRDNAASAAPVPGSDRAASAAPAPGSDREAPVSPAAGSDCAAAGSSGSGADLSSPGLPARYILYFGRFSEEKGIGTLLKVCRELPEIPFVFAGKGPLEEEVNQCHNISNVGFLSGGALERLIRNAYISVFPSECYENCPFSVMESQMYGTPVLGADIGGVPELIRPAETGELFRSGDAEDLKAHIQRLWDEPETAARYREGCRDVRFDTVEEYSEKLLWIYRGETSPL